jgi:hypothetical protein
MCVCDCLGPVFWVLPWLFPCLLVVDDRAPSNVAVDEGTRT